MAGPVGLDPAEDGTDPKSALNQYCHRYCARPVTKTDVVYTKTKFGTKQIQAIVKLNCIAGQEYAGEVCSSAKEAEKSAAYQALQAYRSVVLPHAELGAKKKKKRLPVMVQDAVTGELVERGPPDYADNPAMTDKVRLNSAYMRIVKRALRKGETVYECSHIALDGAPDGGYLATVRLLCLPGEWSSRVFEGEACVNKQEATQSAAKAALAQIMADPELSALASEVAGAPRGGGLKGRGKGLKGKEGYWGKGRHDDPMSCRVRAVEGLAYGEVLEWKGYFGWIRPSQEPEHPAACRREGKVYVHQQDLAEGASELQVGAKVQFLLYCDPSGLGAEQVAPV